MMKYNEKMKQGPIISVIGAGSWGTAIGLLLSRKGYAVKMWDYDPEHVQKLKKDRENKEHIAGVSFPETLYLEPDIKKAVEHSQIIVMVIPSHGFRAVIKQVIPIINEDAIIVSATKGIENETMATMSEIINQSVNEEKKDSSITTAVLSGPSFAREVADMVPTAVTIACKDPKIALYLQEIFNADYFRVYTSDDIVGLEVSASLKNIVAIAAGICDGLGFGTNTRAALITRGLTEIVRLGKALGAHAETFYGLSGMGDLVLTCTGDLSRNRTVGLLLGEGKTLDEIRKMMNMVAEGIKTTKSVYELKRKLNIEMPILEQVYKILYENKNCKEAVNDLLQRDLKAE